MPTTIVESHAVRRTEKRQKLPPFFDGQLRLQIVMAVSKWGPMRLFEIEELLGKTFRSSRTNQAAGELEELGIVVRVSGGYRNVTIGLDRRHPGFNDIQRIGRALYREHLAPVATKTPKQRRRPISPREPKHGPDRHDMHALGQLPRIRFLHLLAEIVNCPAFVLVRFQGASHATYGSIRELEKHGIVRTVGKGQDVFVRLDRRWHAHEPLWLLLRMLNRYLPQYAALAAAYRTERDEGHYTWKWRLRRNARARASAEAARTPRGKKK